MVVPTWFVVVPVITFIIPAILYLSSVKKSRKGSEVDIIPEALFLFPIIAFIVPMAFFIIFLFDKGVPLLLYILPVATFFISFMFLLSNIMNVRKLAPEAIPYMNARKLRRKGKIADILRVIEGDNTIRNYVITPDEQGNMYVKTKKYGIKISPSMYGEIPSERTPDGINVTNVSPMQITPVNGVGAVAVTELLSRIRKDYPELSYLDDKRLLVLISLQGKELQQDAHLYLNQNTAKQNTTTLSETDIIDIVKEIQKIEGVKEMGIEPGYKFFVYRTAMNAIRCAYTTSFVQDMMLTVKNLTLAEQDKNKVNLLIYVVIIIALLMGGAVAVKMLGV